MIRRPPRSTLDRSSAASDVYKRQDLTGIGPSGAARLLVEVGDITRFPDNNHFGSWTGTAPIDASSGDNVRHRLSRGGNRQINRVLHIMATVQLRNPTEGRAYFCLLYTSDAADERSSVDLGGRRIITKKKQANH